MNRSVKHSVRNLGLFKLGWLACVGFAAAGQPLWSTISVALVVTAHLYWSPTRAKEVVLMLAAAAIGLAWESIMLATGLISFPSHPGHPAIAPYWIVAMWVLFATTINHGMRWVKRSYLVAAIAGGIGGPVAFWGGMNMGAVTFSDTSLALLAIGVGWALLLPLMSLLADTIIDSDWLEAERPDESEEQQVSIAAQKQPEGPDVIQLEWRYD